MKQFLLIMLRGLMQIFFAGFVIVGGTVAFLALVVAILTYGWWIGGPTLFIVVFLALYIAGEDN